MNLGLALGAMDSVEPSHHRKEFDGPQLLGAISLISQSTIVGKDNRWEVLAAGCEKYSRHMKSHRQYCWTNLSSFFIDPFALKLVKINPISTSWKFACIGRSVIALDFCHSLLTTWMPS